MTLANNTLVSIETRITSNGHVYSYSGEEADLAFDAALAIKSKKWNDSVVKPHFMQRVSTFLNSKFVPHDDKSVSFFEIEPKLKDRLKKEILEEVKEDSVLSLNVKAISSSLIEILTKNQIHHVELGLPLFEVICELAKDKVYMKDERLNSDIQRAHYNSVLFLTVMTTLNRKGCYEIKTPPSDLIKSNIDVYHQMILKVMAHSFVNHYDNVVSSIFSGAGLFTMSGFQLRRSSGLEAIKYANNYCLLKFGSDAKNKIDLAVRIGTSILLQRIDAYLTKTGDDFNFVRGVFHTSELVTGRLT